MSTTTIELQEWLDCLTHVTNDYAAHHLRFDTSAPAPAASTPGSPRPAVYVAILGAKISMHLGLVTSVEGAQALTRAFLGVRSQGAIAERDIVDGMSEILNILAGKVKSRMTARDGSLRLGLPMYVSGAVGHGDGIERAVADVTLGPVPCQLHVFRQHRQP
jgi:hypothetical protein